MSAALLLLLAGCKAVGPDYQAPTPPAPTAALAPQPEQGLAVSAEEASAWWSAFNDPALTRLIGQALASNRTLRVVAAQVREARARLCKSRAGLLPQVDASGSYARYRNSDNAGAPGDGDLFSAGFDASWELDLFGRRRRAVEAAQAAFAAECATLDNAWVSLAAETARTYTELQTVRRRLSVAQTNLSVQAQTLDILTSRAKAGLADDLAVEQARYNLERTRATLPGLQSAEEGARNALAVLIGAMPGEGAADEVAPAPIPSASPRTLVGIPADLLRRRPDVRAAERRLAAQTARIGEATADLYPTFKLNGSVGLESLEGGDFFKADSHFFSLGPSVSWPVYRAGSIRANIEIQSALQEQALAAYEQTVLVAVQELRDALSDYAREYERQASLAKAATAARAAVAIAQDQYKNGLADFNSVLDAQRSLLTFEEAAALSEGAITTHLIRVYKALGGGWAPLATP
jgi:NodT family efflux transporter outer membrane factor (OMF) lipoprotein